MNEPTATLRTPQHRRRAAGWRPDIEGLRAVAVLAVVAYHAGVPFLTGGYVGVDVFYVISGFLITGLLWREVGREGRVSFAAFYARRARRLLPAAMLVLVVTMAASAALLPPTMVQSVWKDGLACALYVGNYRFAATGTNYLAAASPSPFQHYWSLGVEEQFYLLWPLLLAGVTLMGGRSSRRVRALFALGALSVLSFAGSLWLTRADEPVAFFSLPTRAWELGLGGLLALASPALRRLPAAVAAALGWAGLAGILAAVVALGAHTPYPGTAALLPVLGSGAVVASGVAAPASGPVLLLGRAAMRAVGRVSYSWYLWHWPVLVLAPYAVGHALSVGTNVALAAGSGLLAVLTYGLVENPGRRARWLAARPMRGLGAGAALSAAGVVACVVAAGATPVTVGHGQAPIAAIHPAAPSTSPTTSRPTSSPTTVPPVVTAYRSAETQVEAAVARSATVRVVPANLDPPLSQASSSEAVPMVDGCLLGFTASTPPTTCVFGDTGAHRSVVLWGDSHAAMWFPAVDAWASAHHDRLVVETKAACPPVDITLFSPTLDEQWAACSDWRAAVQSEIASLHPALTVLAIAPNYDAAYHVVQDGSAWVSGVTEVVRAVRAAGSEVVLMGAIPGPTTIVPDCVSAHPDDLTHCDFSPVGRRVTGGGLIGLQQAGNARVAAAVTAAGGTYVDDTPWFCTATTCDVVVDNLLVYRDNSHITVPFATYLSPLVADALDAATTGVRLPPPAGAPRG